MADCPPPGHLTLAVAESPHQIRFSLKFSSTFASRRRQNKHFLGTSRSWRTLCKYLGVRGRANLMPHTGFAPPAARVLHASRRAESQQQALGGGRMTWDSSPRLSLKVSSPVQHDVNKIFVYLSVVNLHNDHQIIIRHRQYTTTSHRLPRR